MRCVLTGSRYLVPELVFTPARARAMLRVFDPTDLSSLDTATHDWYACMHACMQGRTAGPHPHPRPRQGESYTERACA